MMNPGPHRRYSLQFKLQAIDAALAGEASLKSIARRLGISHSLLLFWLEKHRQGLLTEEDNLLEKLREHEVQIAALERKVGQLTMEIEHLRATETPASAGFVMGQPADLDSSDSSNENDPTSNKK